MILTDSTPIYESAQPSPTGNGRIVLLDAIHELWPEDDVWMCTLLLERAVQGKTKYGTYLRAHNGRNALQDALEEALDGFMYATQANMETPSFDAERLQEMFLEAAKLCKVLMDGRPSPTQAFDAMRAEFGDKFEGVE